MPTEAFPSPGLHGQTAESATSGLQGQFLDIFMYLGSEWVLYLLLILSIVSVAVTIERIIHFVQHRFDIEKLQDDLGARLANGELDAARKLLTASRSHVAAILLRGMDALDRGAASVEEVMAGATQVERLKMERGLSFLGTLGNNAPFIGLFGTVLGVTRAVLDLATHKKDWDAVLPGIGEALVATAVGLLVALPAVAVFNAFQRAIRTNLVASEAMTRLLLAHAKSEKD